MKTKDGVDFYLGMKLITEFGREKQTSVDEHEVIESQGIFFLQRIGGHFYFDLRLFFSSWKARNEYILSKMKKTKEFIDEAILEYEKEISGEGYHYCLICCQKSHQMAWVNKDGHCPNCLSSFSGITLEIF